MADRQVLREHYMAESPQQIFGEIMEMMTRKEKPLRLEESFVPGCVSINDIYFMCHGRDKPLTEVWITDPQQKLQEDINSTMFSKITSNIIQRVGIDAYDSAEKVGDQLVQNVPSKLKTDTITGFSSGNLIDEEVAEGAAYTHSDFKTDKFVTAIEPKKIGRLIDVTNETIIFDVTNSIINETKEEMIALSDTVERKIFFGVTDQKKKNAFVVFRPSGVQTQIYKSSQNAVPLNNFVTGANTKLDLVNGVEAIQSARNSFSDNRKDSTRTQNDQPILFSPQEILIGDKDIDIVDALLNSKFNPVTANRSDNPLQNTRHRYKVIPSQWIDILRSNAGAAFSGKSIDTNAWFMGTFKKQFKYKQVIPAQMVSIRGDERRDIIFSMLVREKGDVFAVDNKYVSYIRGA